MRNLKIQLEEAKKRAGGVAPRARIEEMSSEVVDSNPYSRLMALKRMGIVSNYEEIRKFSVVRGDAFTCLTAPGTASLVLPSSA